MTRYFDASALVKGYVDEPGSDAVRRMLSSGARVATSRIAFAEVASAIARRCRNGDLTAATRDRVFATMTRDAQSCQRLDVSDEVVRGAMSLVRDHPLRGFDALHLASCLLLARSLPVGPEFVCSDAGLLRAASACGLRVVNPET